MAEVTFIPDHDEQILRRLLSQFSEATNLRSLLGAVGLEMQAVEIAGQQLVEERTIDKAAGEQLDLLGEIVGEDRDGRDDEAYRTGIVARIAANTSRATPEHVLDTLRIATRSDAARIIEASVMSLYLYTDSDFIPDSLHAVIRAAAPVATADIIIIAGYGNPFEDLLFVSEYQADLISNFAVLSEWDVTGGDDDYYFEGAAWGELILEEEA